MLRFPQFQATRRAVDDAREELGIGHDEPMPAYIYDLNCYIDRQPDGMFNLVLDRTDWIDRDLTKLERILWSQHYLYEAVGFDEPCLRKDDGTLTDFLVGWCHANNKPYAGGMLLFGGKDRWTVAEAGDVLRNSFRSAESGEVMIFARGRWEFATQEKNAVNGCQQWIRRDQSFICKVGEEAAVAPVSSRPVPNFGAALTILAEAEQSQTYMTTTKLKPIPEFASEDEEDAFWQTHDSTEYVDWSKAERAHRNLTRTLADRSREEKARKDAPPFTAFAVLQAMTQGLFRDLTDGERAAFAGAPDDALIGTVPGSEDTWIVIVSVGESGIGMEAFGSDPIGADPRAFGYLGRRWIEL